MKHRHITSQVLAALADTPVVLVQGPRQLGKTTLVQGVRKLGHAAEYRTLDDAGVLAAARRDFKGLRHLCEQTGRRFLRGILLYTGSMSAAFAPNLHAVPVSALWQLEAALAEP